MTAEWRARHAAVREARHAADLAQSARRARLGGNLAEPAAALQAAARKPAHAILSTDSVWKPT
jgi:hypothetical protein